jgi:hypothetical protein
MNQNVTIFKNIKATAAGFVRPVGAILDRIHTGKSKELIERIRNASDDSERNKLKEQLPSICFSGEFQTRSKIGLKKHSGLICLDFDKLPDEEALKAEKERLIHDPYTFAVFISPSGYGVKCLVKIPSDPENHERYFEALSAYYDSPFFDNKTKDVSRVCYESYDPDLFVNPESLVWSERLEKDIYDIGTNTAILPVKSENQIIENLLKWFNRKFGVSKGNRNSNLFILASAFNDFGIKQHEAERICFQFSEPDFTEREISKIIHSAYRKVENHGTRFFEDDAIKSKIEKAIRQGKSEKDIAREYSVYDVDQIHEATADIKERMTVTDYWDYDDKGRIKIVPHKFKFYLQQNQFYKYYPDGATNFFFIRIIENKVEPVSPAKIKDFVLEELLNNTEIGYAPYDHVANSPKLFKEEYLNLLDSIDLQIVKDTETDSYLFFKNGAVKVTKDKAELINYFNLDGYVWKNHVINVDFEPVKWIGCDFERFLGCVAGKDKGRAEAIRNVIGYLLHSYKTSSNNKAIILNDETISDNPNGGSGKGLFFRAISYLKRIAVLDGKQFDHTKSFPYQTVGIDTQILLFDDVRKNFSFESLFSLITEGITIEKKNKDAVKLHVTNSPKIGITTNYTVSGAGGSHERRKYEVEFSSYFSSKHTPEMELGRLLFEEWDKEEWNKFYSFMIHCLACYLREGLKTAKFVNLDERKFINQTSSEFHEFVTDIDTPFVTSVKLIKSAIYEQFLGQYPDVRKFLSQKRFAGWLERFGEYKGWNLTTGKDHSGRWVMYDKS